MENANKTEKVIKELVEQGLIKDVISPRPLYQDFPPARVSIPELVKRVGELERLVADFLHNAWVHAPGATETKSK
jgi:hypothetical protein